MTSTTKEVEAQGYTCSKCKTHHTFPMYVYANWDYVVDHTCQCGAVHGVRRGHASIKKQARKKDLPSNA